MSTEERLWKRLVAFCFAEDGGLFGVVRRKTAAAACGFGYAVRDVVQYVNNLTRNLSVFKKTND